MRLFTRTMLALIVAATCIAPAGASEIRSDEEVVFFPTAAHLDKTEGEWVIPIHGWIFEPETNSLRRRAGIEAFKLRLELDPDDPGTAILEQRLSAFLVDNERGKRLEIAIGDDTYQLSASEQSGHIRDALRIPTPTVDSLSRNGRLTFEAVTRADDDRRFSGHVQLIEPDGLSVISDIDDTIKVSNVTDKRVLIRRTFFEEFEAVEGMAALYESWNRDGATFHFVSSSPWQLYPDLSAFCQEAGFPDAVWHLKDVRLRDSTVLNLLADPYETKLLVIGSILARYPDREFILVGDSGEQDPEVYGETARRHPQQVSRILIRRASDEQVDAERFRQAFQDLPREIWTVFDDPAQLQMD